MLGVPSGQVCLGRSSFSRKNGLTLTTLASLAARTSASFLFLAAFLLAVASEKVFLSPPTVPSRPLGTAVSRVDASPPRATRRASPARSPRVLPPSAPAPITRWKGALGASAGVIGLSRVLPWPHETYCALLMKHIE